MKKVVTSFIVSNVAQPIKKGTLDHLQSSWYECLEALAKTIIGEGYSTTKLYILYGCVNSTTAPVYTISAGAVFFNGEIYLVDAVTFTATGSDVAVGTIAVTYLTSASADPVVFTDGTSHNVHQIRKMVFAAAAAGSGDVNYSNIGNGWVSVSDASQASLITSPAGATIDACVVETLRSPSYKIKRFKITFTMSSGSIKIGFPLTSMVSDSIAQSIMCPIYASYPTISNLGNATVNGTVLEITSSTGSLGAGTFIVTGQILYKIN